MIEAFLGRGLVLLEYVGANATPGRAVYLALHLVNTQVLLAMLALTAWFARNPDRKPRRISWAIGGTLAAALLVSITGAIAALGDTLYPATSLAEGMRQDMSAAAHFLVRLRVFHPVLAVIAGVYFAWAAIRVVRSNAGGVAGRIGMMALILTMAQLAAGGINLAMLAPIPLQIVHLLLADLVWLSLVLLTVEATPQA